MTLPYSLIRAGLFRLDAETAHGLSLRALASGLMPRVNQAVDPRIEVRAFGLTFPNPLGMAAGYDKNAEVADAVLDMGFGFAEVGTLTPRPQPGNPRPRSFRLVEDEALINRFGFNNDGHAAAHARLAARKSRLGIVGVNIGANKETEDKAADYVKGIEAFADVASYFTVNISSPNTPGLRDLQARAALADLLGRVVAARDAVAVTGGRRVPVLLKIAPDMDDAGFADVAEEVLAHGIDGLIVSNTTIDRTGLKPDKHMAEAGGLSGRPVFVKSTVALARMRKLVGPSLPIVGVGGVDSVAAAIAKIEAGANLIQLYTGLVFKGPDLVGVINRGLADYCRREGLASLSEAVGRRVDEWAARRAA
ncbi:MAG: quinone-dependent dihydroorotate dehydrogenase [Hyphomicrobiaceae bacterium]|nr:quinone-dependent dihydroorotate dehydrogenase [Hyphomicrobiaceae bacterium]